MYSYSGGQDSLKTVDCAHNPRKRRRSKSHCPTQKSTPGKTLQMTYLPHAKITRPTETPLAICTVVLLGGSPRIFRTSRMRQDRITHALMRLQSLFYVGPRRPLCLWTKFVIWGGPKLLFVQAFNFLGGTFPIPESRHVSEIKILLARNVIALSGKIACCLQTPVTFSGAPFFP